MWALTTGEPYGVLGGQSVSERRALLHRHAGVGRQRAAAVPTAGPGAPGGPGGLPGGEHHGRGMSTVSCTPGQLEDAVLASASTARWPDGSLLLELDENVLRDVLVPRLLAALASTTTSSVPG